MRVTQLGEANHLSWMADVEQVCKLKDCWDVVVAPVPAVGVQLLEDLEEQPSKAGLAATLADPNATADDKRHASSVMGALEWRRKDQVAQAILKLNLESGKHDALKECVSAHEVYNKVRDSFTSRGLSGKIELRRRLCNLRKKPQESMTGFINRAAMLKVEMDRMGISTPEEELVAALLAGLPTAYAGTVELLENHGPEDLAGVTRRLLAAELKHQRLERDEDQAVALAAVPAASTRPVEAGVAPAAARGPTYPGGPPLQPQLVMPGYGPPPGFAPLPNPYHMPPSGGYFPMNASSYGHGAPPARAVRTCWGCGQPGHIHRQCANNPMPRPQYAGPAGGMTGYGRPPATAFPTAGERDYPRADGRLAPGYRAPARDHAAPRQAPPGPNGLAMMALVVHETTLLDGDDWIIDSGASHHMTSSPFSLASVYGIDPVGITLAGGQTIYATQAGDVTTTLHTADGRVSLRLQGVLVVPGLAVNLFSVKAATRRGFGAYFYDGGVDLLGEVGVVFKGLTRGNVYILPTTDASPYSATTPVMAAAAVAAPVWHGRLAHAAVDAVMRTSAAVDGMDIAGAHPRRDLGGVCDACVVSKMCPKPFPSSTTTTGAPLELVHTDVCGPMPVASLGGARYVVTVLDDHSGAHDAVPIASKADAGEAIRDVIVRWEARTGRRLLHWRSDRGGEYMSNSMAAWTRNRGATHETTAPYTPQQNGKAERLHPPREGRCGDDSRGVRQEPVGRGHAHRFLHCQPHGPRRRACHPTGAPVRRTALHRPSTYIWVPCVCPHPRRAPSEDVPAW